MSQNTSSAVMQQRSEPHDSLDDFPTPPWATRAMLHELRRRGFSLIGTCREPCANRGHMVRPLREVFSKVDAADVHDYGAGFPVRDFLFGPDPEPVDWTFANPPFRLAQQFIERMHRTSRIGCAVLVRTSFIEGCDRHNEIFAKMPPRLMLQYAERVVMHKGKLSPDGSTATSYCWLIWKPGRVFQHPPELGWIAPCRKSFERPGDYEVAA
jgi:hypothetical protein